MKVTCYDKDGNVIDPATAKVPKEIKEQISRIFNKNDNKKRTKKGQLYHLV
ncbi:hypothetical protein [Macrococcoides caseolyticum]|uniref:hypothetical protein n=1 Tax=Macrococcoides caseolyticum TaxID=69966 RepID=UPI001F2BD8F5|nr:hypothetical protein [Macrococcus caseolyticus]MCE4957467.1 hypothetical protein [Macrococcus caseolyticus]